MNLLSAPGRSVHTHSPGRSVHTHSPGRLVHTHSPGCSVHTYSPGTQPWVLSAHTQPQALSAHQNPGCPVHTHTALDILSCFSLYPKHSQVLIPFLINPNFSCFLASIASSLGLHPFLLGAHQAGELTVNCVQSLPCPGANYRLCLTDKVS